MKIVDVYCSDIQKRTKKLLKKIFGYRTIADGLEERKHCRKLIENCTEKNINEVDFELIKKSMLCEVYAKYRTFDFYYILERSRFENTGFVNSSVS